MDSSCRNGSLQHTDTDGWSPRRAPIGPWISGIQKRCVKTSVSGTAVVLMRMTSRQAHCRRRWFNPTVVEQCDGKGGQQSSKSRARRIESDSGTGNGLHSAGEGKIVDRILVGEIKVLVEIVADHNTHCDPRNKEESSAH